MLTPEGAAKFLADTESIARAWHEHIRFRYHFMCADVLSKMNLAPETRQELAEFFTPANIDVMFERLTPNYPYRHTRPQAPIPARRVPERAAPRYRALGPLGRIERPESKP